MGRVRLKKGTRAEAGHETRAAEEGGTQRVTANRKKKLPNEAVRASAAPRAAQRPATGKAALRRTLRPQHVPHTLTLPTRVEVWCLAYGV
eukprot:scaffold12131_cov112-Isochrysis_galbana.AAC.13